MWGERPCRAPHPTKHRRPSTSAGKVVPEESRGVAPVGDPRGLVAAIQRTLRQAQALLATGNSDGVDEELAGTEAALSGRTQLDVAAAREALSRSDSSQARHYLVAALEERRALR
jgi:hypothetical protein